jgi:hypothetical protein
MMPRECNHESRPEKIKAVRPMEIEEEYQNKERRSAHLNAGDTWTETD